ncbi:uncharacterized protein LOC130962940 [Arachis stenosperma]|uniref:uncharacterized protein LOC130962940 n=1 Tax=Arachis stenosperma TaxID=217475 RepID=UPI0025AD1247|nr:uncharacterized protein LOC130962940 [Arachis stenosperma]
MQECSLVIRERPANQPQHSLPTASQVAAITVGDDIETMVRGRDIKVQTHAGKLRWVRQRQKELRVELKCWQKNDITIVVRGQYMTQRYEDRMAIILKEGKPDIFLTMTCNSSWSEIASKLSPTQTPQDHPDLATKIFRAKFEQLKQDVITKGVLEKFGLSGIPCKETEPHLHEAVLRHMVYGPCGTLNQSSPCMKNGQCKLDNRWVVSYNPWLLLKYDCHLNVQICSSIKSIKYLYKYCYKGLDRVAMDVHRSSHYDEVQQFIDARWIAAPEVYWRIFRFNLYQMYPSVERLQVHLPN